MKKIIKLVTAAAVMGALAAAFTMTALGATKKGIPTVSLEIEGELYPETRIEADALEVKVKSGSYTVSDYTFTNAGFEWSLTDVPQLEITLTAEEGYRFTLTSAKDVKLSGAGAKYIRADKKDNWETLVLTVSLTPLAESLSEIEEVSWSSGSVANWDESIGAGGYEVKLIRDGKKVGAAKITEKRSYDFASILTRPGTYQFEVRAVNAVKSENKSKWVQSGNLVISAEQAALFRAGATAGGWKQDDKGWWYQNEDSSYTQNNWQLIEESWYFFDGAGYMKTGWIEWEGKSYYCTENGDMLMNATTPDGHQVDGSGVKVS